MRLVLLIAAFCLAGAASLAAQEAPSLADGPRRLDPGLVRVEAPSLTDEALAVADTGAAPLASPGRRHSNARLAAGGIVGGTAGFWAGLIAGALIDGDDEDCIDFCFGPGLVLGALAGEALGGALGVHLANGRRGNLANDMLVSTGVLAAGVLASVETPELLIAVPVGQLAGVISAERAGERRRRR